MTLFSRFRRVSRPAGVRRVRLGLEYLEDRQLLSAVALTTPPALPNALVNRIAQAEFVQDNGQLTRTDVINLLDVVDGTETATFSQGQVSFTAVSNPATATPLGDHRLDALQTLVQDAPQWGLTPDVANLAGKVVNYSAATEHYQGHKLLASGALAAGDPVGDVQDLVNKWFNGGDLPAIGIKGVKYEVAQGSLFGPNGPSPSDVAQGAGADCYFMSTLAETALKTPQVIQNMFIDDGNGIYTVRFFQYDSTSGSWQPDYVTVNSELPVNKQGQFVFANADFGGQATDYTSSSNVLWVALAEKAYAQLAEEGWSRAIGTTDGSGTSSNPPGQANAYSTLDYGRNLVAEQQITGSANGSWVSFPATNQKTSQNNLAAIFTEFQNGDLVTFATNATVEQSTGLIGYHVYSMTGYNAKKGTVTLTNPYWNNGQKVVTVNLDVLEENTQGAAVIVPN
ncbi:MAG TPA: C2 family cysteine protease [Gemmataceae bacterium]|jgi:hypothetical protein|nr:C2 family cysteine protease [Gemmataceae bacterium]